MYKNDLDSAANYYTLYTEQLGKNSALSAENDKLKQKVNDLEKQIEIYDKKITAMDSELYDLESFIQAMSEDEVETVLKRMVDIMRQRYKSFWGRDFDEYQNIIKDINKVANGEKITEEIIIAKYNTWL